jgi:hypothetical protein
MPILDPADTKKLPARPTATTFCDRCRKLGPCTQSRARAGRIEWLCVDACAPNPQQLLHDLVRNDPPPRDAVNSPELAQWFEPVPPEDLDADIPDELLDLELDRQLAAEDEAREGSAPRDSEPIRAERGRAPDDQEGL